MLGFSIQKLLFTVAVVVAVWYGFKWVGRMKQVRDREREKLRRQARNDGAGGARGASGDAPGDDQGDAQGDTEEMTECPVCGAFVTAQGPKSCGKEACPYPG